MVNTILLHNESTTVSGWMSEDRLPAEASHFSLFRRVHTGSVAHTAYYQMDSGGYIPGGKRQALKLTTHLQIVLRWRMVELYLHLPTCLHGILFNYIIKYKDKLTFF
jgi:hypothetical protein